MIIFDATKFPEYFLSSRGADGGYKKMPPATTGAADGIELGLLSHVEAAVEVLTSAFGSPCIEGLLRRKLRMSRLELRECLSIASGY